ncbi:hypothetical protein SDC9_65510 [bioreactor metagenome]|uniref:Uncharacterized protein n=1 Tax=bioreactor metagenome TaxID=1076179 RepID=A0A644XS69_9ZZZZ
MASVACSYVVVSTFCFYHESIFFKFLYKFLSACKTVHSFVFSSFFIHSAVFVHAVDLFKIVSKPDFKVVRVVAWSYFKRSGSLFHVRILISYYWDFSSNKRNYNLFTYEVFVSFIIRMSCYGNVSEYCFRPCCCNNKVLLRIFNIWIFYVVVFSRYIFMLNFCI